MATYVMSDIHGCYTEFRTMLEKIAFDGTKDELIIAGDIVDRGKENYEMLEYAASKPEGVTFLMGNHDMDFIYYVEQLEQLYKDGRIPEGMDLPTFVNDDDGMYIYDTFVIDQYETIRKLILDPDRPVTLEDLKRWAACLAEYPFYVRREFGDNRYIIVHAGYISEKEFKKARRIAIRYRMDIREFYVWAREEGLDYGEAGTTVIFGHTPTIAEHTFYNQGRVWIRRKGKKRFINIDCGCVFGSWEPEANLACIRLEDEKIFYLKED